ncbi:DUF6779 domain-containing protein [Corynebacterium lactis]|uniref:DUF6779 domain-containing protein n=1 Tax=Corynebacterium lactis RW2-5 TaxID=1408189 RepID=A0A0K2H3S6_9CORY|nr:DUF6779 domain-containing protein [Corynebacterium lactis]ALA68700.1 hypothetical protein CLAC_10835 [Corynebacterium lactis RW2-5]
MTDFPNAGNDPKQSENAPFDDSPEAIANGRGSAEELAEPTVSGPDAQPVSENPGNPESKETMTEKTAVILMIALLVLAVLASVVMLFATSTGWMKIAVLFALWSAVIGAVLVTRYRKTIAADRDRLETIEQLHQVELDRELATHREQELILEQNYLDSLEGNNDESIAALRAEIFALREQLAQFMGEEFDDEQVALRARAERLRELDAPQQSSPMKDPVGNDRPEPRATAHRAEMTANGAVGVHTQHGVQGSPVEEAEDTNIQSEFKPSGSPVDVSEVAAEAKESNKDDAKGGAKEPEDKKFSTDTFRAIHWQETPGGQEDADWSSKEAEDPTRQLQAITDDEVDSEESSRHGRRRAEDHKNGLTVAELIAQMRKK